MSSPSTPAPASSSLADRISRPTEASETAEGKIDTTTGDDTVKPSWADELASPTTAGPPAEATATTKPDAAAADDTKPQEDGAGELLGGSDLREPDYNVEVKLSDIQADPNNPLYSVKSFEELGGL
jgi:ATP-dependent RNA helicase DDX19/DBP5